MLCLTVWCQPVISPSGPHVVVPQGGRLELRCHDSDATSASPSGVRWERAHRLEGEVKEGAVASVTLPEAKGHHMGRYVCVNNSTRQHSSIYVYVKGGCFKAEAAAAAA